MSPIDSNALASNLASYVPPGEGLASEPSARARSAPRRVADDIRFGPWGLEPVAAEPFQMPGQSGTSGHDVSSLRELLNGLVAALSSLVDGLAGLLQGAGTPAGGSAPAAAQSFFRNASASSVGDPHDAFSGTTGAGRSVSARWDDMLGHDDLLSSDSFSGGYRVSTSPTQPGPGGVTQNGGATVSVADGAASATLNHDGSYAVTLQGRKLTLETGRPTPLGSGATVTLNADRSLRIDDRTAEGGELSTTLKANGTGGVDVASDARGVDLGGYLVQGTADDPDRPYAKTLQALEST